MVQITHARMGVEDGKPVLVSAKTYHKETHGRKPCHCPDANCPAILVHHKKHFQTFYNLTTGDAYKLSIPSFFQRHPKSPPHAPTCTAVDHYAHYQNYARSIAGVGLSHGAFVYNLNIPTKDLPERTKRSARRLSGNFALHVAPKDVERETYIHRKLSEGISSVKKIAGLLDATEFDRDYRDATLLRDGPRHFTLSRIFKNDIVALFREEGARARNGAAPTPVLLHFKPIVMGKYHSRQDWTIQGQAKSIKGIDGHTYYVSAKLNCGSKDVYEAVKRDIRGGKRSFLIYAECATVDLFEFAQKKKDIQAGNAKDNAVFVHIRINMPEQITPWTPYNGQLDLEQAGMDLPPQPKPPREIPQHLIK